MSQNLNKLLNLDELPQYLKELEEMDNYEKIELIVSKFSLYNVDINWKEYVKFLVSE